MVASGTRPVPVDPPTANAVLPSGADAVTCLACSPGSRGAVVCVLSGVAPTVEHTVRACAGSLRPSAAPTLTEEGPGVALGGVGSALMAGAIADPSTPGVVLPAGTYAHTVCTRPIARLTTANGIRSDWAVLAAALGDLGRA